MIRLRWAVPLVLLLALFSFHERLFAALGGYLVKTDPPSKADVVFVLAGDPAGNRILKAAELVREGYAPKAMISGPDGMYGFHECDLAISFAVKAGFPESEFLHFENEAHSTQEEVNFAVAEFHKRNYRKILVVTSDYHTRRAGRVLRAAAPDLQFAVVSAPDNYFSAGAWWTNREGRKTFLYEWLKTLGYWYGL